MRSWLCRECGQAPIRTGRKAKHRCGQVGRCCDGNSKKILSHCFHIYLVTQETRLSAQHNSQKDFRREVRIMGKLLL